MRGIYGSLAAACISMGVTEALRATRGDDDEWDEQDDEALVGGREKICDVVPVLAVLVVVVVINMIVCTVHIVQLYGT